MPLMFPAELSDAPEVQSLIRETADGDMEVALMLTNRVMEVAQIIRDIERDSGKLAQKDQAEQDNICLSIVCQAASTLEPKESALRVFHEITGWFGPGHVDDLSLSWDTKAAQDEYKASRAAAPPLFTAPPCGGCEHHRSKSNPNKGKLIPNHHGKCIRPEGLCETVKPAAAPASEPDTAPAIPEITPEREAEITQVQNTAATVDQAVLESGEAFRAIGQIESLDFLRHVADVAAAQAYEKLKKDKAYKNLPYIGPDGNRRHVATLEEFCETYLGKSARRVRELAKNLHVLGPDLYESAERIGFKSRDYRALQALPSEEQAVIKEAMASEDKGQVLDILQDMAARHASQREADRKEKEDLAADLEARGELLKTKTERMDALAMELEKLKRLPENKREELRLEREAEAAKKLTTACMEALAGVNSCLLQLAEIKAAEVSHYTKEHADWTASWLCQQINHSLEQNGIQVDFTEIAMPEWMHETAAESPLSPGEEN